MGWCYMNSDIDAICVGIQDPNEEPLRASQAHRMRLGADDLVALAEWRFRDRPFQLRLARAIYERCCADLTLALETGSR